jgi:hypothetical protein
MGRADVRHTNDNTNATRDNTNPTRSMAEESGGRKKLTLEPQHELLDPTQYAVEKRGQA